MSPWGERRVGSQAMKQVVLLCPNKDGQRVSCDRRLSIKNVFFLYLITHFWTNNGTCGCLDNSVAANQSDQNVVEKTGNLETIRQVDITLLTGLLAAHSSPRKEHSPQGGGAEFQATLYNNSTWFAPSLSFLRARTSTDAP